VKLAAWLQNHIPNRNSWLALLELLTKTKTNHRDILHLQAWGYLAFILNPKVTG
jgi:hypothetical protein